MSDKAEVRYHLHRLLAGPSPGRDPRVIHASDVIDDDEWWCPRSQALMVHHDVAPANERLSTAESVVYTGSSDAADRIVSWLADAGIAVGDWECVPCGQVHEFSLRPGCCEGCGASVFKYREIRFTSQDSGISGSVDVLVYLSVLDVVRVVEIKALQKSDFESLILASGKHRLRTNLYTRLVQESSHPEKNCVDPERAIVLYAVKGGYGYKTDDPASWGLTDKPWSPFKEYLIERDDSATDRFAEAARPLHLFLTGRSKELPTRIPKCTDSGCKRARSCEVRTQCWSLA